MSRRILSVFAGVFASWALAGSTAAQEQISAEEWSAKLAWQSGDVQIAHGAATLHFAQDFRYLAPDEARKVLVQAWGNPEESTQGVLGMIFAAEMNPAAQDSWGIVLSFEEDGYVSDEGAEKLDFAAMLKEMQEGTRQSSEARQESGLEAVELVGWAEPPHYDRAAHKLYWAKELRFGGSEATTLNYNIRVLGRRGVLVLNAVSGMGDLTRVKGEVERLLPRVEFNEGHRFADYVPGQDRVAEYGIAALIAGGAMAAVKTGLFKWLIATALAFKKVLLFGAIAAAEGVRRLVMSRRAGSTPRAED
jgi:uncharacterized membrane-anchored protein